MIRAQSDLMLFLEAVYQPLTLITRDTLGGYRTAVRLLDDFAGRPRWEQLTPELIGAALSDYIERGGSRVTALAHYRALHAVLAAARRRKLTKIRLSQIPKPRAEQKLPVAWSLDEFSRLVQAASKLPGRVGPWPKRDWFPALLLTCWSTDWRISAVMAIQTARCDLASGRVVSYETKTRQERAADLSPETIEAIAKIWGPRPELFGDWRADRQARQWKQLNKLLARVIRSAGVRDIGRFHAIRKTATTAMAATLGLDAAARFAGHASHNVTARHYIDPTQLPKTGGSKLPRLGI